MPSEKDQKKELLDKLNEQRQVIFDQLRHLAETMPESAELKQAKADLADFEKLEQEISDYDVTEKYKPTSITQARKLLFQVLEHLELDKLFMEDPLYFIGLFDEIKTIYNLINKESSNYYDKQAIGKDVLRNIDKLKLEEIEKRRQLYEDENTLKGHILESWKEKGLSAISEEQWSRNIALWAASQKYDNISLEFFKYLPEKYRYIPYVFKNLIRANLNKKTEILKFVPEYFTEKQKSLIETIIQEAEMLFNVSSNIDNSRKITINAKEKNENTILITSYQAKRIKKEVGDNFKVVDFLGHEFKVKVETKKKKNN